MGCAERNVVAILKILCGFLQMKGCIKVLKEQPSNSVEGLLNALKYVCLNKLWLNGILKGATCKINLLNQSNIV